MRVGVLVITLATAATALRLWGVVPPAFALFLLAALHASGVLVQLKTKRVRIAPRRPFMEKPARPRNLQFHRRAASNVTRRRKFGFT